MLTYFPARLPDELLFSRLARYHRHTCSLSAKHTLDELFADRSVRASVDLQCHLRALSNRMPIGSYEHPIALCRDTLLGYYSAFQPTKIVEAARSAMIDGPAAGLHARLGIAAGLRLPPARLRWCPVCNEEARARHGETYWRRSHQLPGVLICPDHDTVLLAARMPERCGQHEFIAASRETCVHPVGSAAEWSKTGKVRCLLREIAQRAIGFLDAPQLFTNFAAIDLHCRSRLIETGLARPSGRLYLDRLTEAAESALRQLRPVYPEANGTNWLLAMGRKHRRSFSALQHILFELVLEAAPAQSPKRKAPKPRKFLANNPTFEVRLRSAAAKAMGLRAAARAVGVDPRTIQRHATRLGLDSPWKKVETETRRNPPNDRETDSKQRWLRAVESGMNRKELRSANSADWTWLKRHHPRWLEEHSPDAIQRSAPKPRKDWSDIDAAIAPSIAAAASVIRGRVPPSRITMAAIERELGRKGWFSPRLRKLPLCKATFAKEKEGLEAFKLRRVEWARETLLANCKSAQPWQVHRLAGLPKKVSRRIASAICGGPAQ